MPTEEDFRALARSSPWLWRSARFTLQVRSGGDAEPVRAWLRRPDALRVEALDGRLLQAGVEPPRRVAVLTTDGGVSREMDSRLPDPDRRRDGLVVDRSAVARPDTDAPFFRDYRWVAVADQLEDRPLARYADAHHVVLDRATGICVATAELGGPHHGWGHELVLETVDVSLDDRLFAPPGERRCAGA